MNESSLIMAALAVLLAWAAFALHRLRRALHRERAENRRLRELIRTGSREADAELERARRLRHDLRHYPQIVGGGTPPDALLPELSAGQERSAVDWGGSWAVSSLVCYYQAQAEAEGFLADLQLEHTPVPEALLPDVCLVLSNLLENAVEALRREGGGWLRARSASAEGYLTIVVGNASSARLRWVNGRCLSSKAEGRFGVGLATVQDIARKYGGCAEFTADGREIRASVLLTCPAPAAQVSAPPSRADYIDR